MELKGNNLRVNIKMERKKALELIIMIMEILNIKDFLGME